jgi:hypothetical protein
MTSGWVSEGHPLPDRGSPERLWWERGAVDEARIEREGLSDDAREVVSYVTEAMRHHHTGPGVAPMRALTNAVIVYTAQQSKLRTTRARAAAAGRIMVAPLWWNVAPLWWGLVRTLRRLLHRSNY